MEQGFSNAFRVDLLLGKNLLVDPDSCFLGLVGFSF